MTGNRKKNLNHSKEPLVIRGHDSCLNRPLYYVWLSLSGPFEVPHSSFAMVFLGLTGLHLSELAKPR